MSTKNIRHPLLFLLVLTLALFYLWLFLTDPSSIINLVLTLVWVGNMLGQLRPRKPSTKPMSAPLVIALVVGMTAIVSAILLIKGTSTEALLLLALFTIVSMSVGAYFGAKVRKADVLAMHSDSETTTRTP